MSLLVFPLLATLLPQGAAATTEEAYAARIARYTTDPRFSNELVDHIPASATLPSPLEHFGAIIGAPEILHDTAAIYGYFDALAKASPRVRARRIGHTEEGRPMNEYVIGTEAALSNLARYRRYLRDLADPRRVGEVRARRLAGLAKPVYMLIGGLHSPETGSPEMLMELAYRLAAGSSALVKSIRNHLIVVMIPVAEPDGRDRMVDVYNYRRDHEGVGPGLRYWGKYVAHDNNRDGFGLSLALTRNILGSYFHWHPTVMHDLHESVPFLYISTGTGPYNEYVDPIVVDEWHRLAHEEVGELTRRGMPGVWTHGFYSGWGANYLIWIANTRNSIGRFYETYGNSGADTIEREVGASSTSREWYRPNPPLAKVRWSLRNNINYMQSGVLIGLGHVARERRRYLESSWTKAERSIDKGRSTAPYAYVIPRRQRRSVTAIRFVNLLMQQGLEVHVLSEDHGNVKRGTFVVRCDQPYRTLARVLLDVQTYPKGAKAPYDDTGWTLPYLWRIKSSAIDEKGILDAKMRRLRRPLRVAGRLERRDSRFFVVDHDSSDGFAALRFKLADVRFEAVEAGFRAAGRRFRAGSYLIASAGNPADLTERLEAAVATYGLDAYGIEARPAVSTHALEVPRVGIVHTWTSTPQDAGWWRVAFDRLEIPYRHLSEQDLGRIDLSELDVLLMPRAFSSPQVLVRGTSRSGPALPWRRTEAYPNIGVVAETDDVRRGMGHEGLAKLKRWIDHGGVFLTEGSTCAFPIEMGLTQRVSIVTTKDLEARGSVLRAVTSDPSSPISYGFADTFAVYFNDRPVLKTDTSVGRDGTPAWLRDVRFDREVPRVVMRFAKADTLMSGMLRGANEIAGTPAVVDVPVGRGHVVLLANRAFYRGQTVGSHALVFNTMLNWNDLRTGWPARDAKKER